MTDIPHTEIHFDEEASAKLARQKTEQILASKTGMIIATTRRNCGLDKKSEVNVDVYCNDIDTKAIERTFQSLMMAMERMGIEYKHLI